jgi:hypothetical protein
MNSSSKRSKFQGLKKHSASSSPSSSSNINANKITASRNFNNSDKEIPSKSKISNELSYHSVAVKNKLSDSPTNSSKFSITLSTSSESSSSQRIDNKNLIKNKNYDSLSRFKMNNNVEQFL